MSRGPVILAFDTAAAACSAAVWRDGAVAARRFERMARGHAEALLPMIGQVMADTGTRYADLDRIAVTVGPGAFTGLRIGLAAARGLALAAPAEVLGVTTFAAVAESVPAGERTGRPLLVLLDTKRSDVYAQLFDPVLSPMTEPACLPPEELPTLLPPGEVLVAGDAVPSVREALVARAPNLAFAAGCGLPDAGNVARIAARILDGTAPAGLTAAPEPLYLRAPDVHRPQPPGGSSF